MYAKINSITITQQYWDVTESELKAFATYMRNFPDELLKKHIYITTEHSFTSINDFYKDTVMKLGF